MAMQTGPGGKVDRQTTTPFHLKLFYKVNVFHKSVTSPCSPLVKTQNLIAWKNPTRLEEFPTATSGNLPPHLQIYTWPSCTLRELSHLLVSALPRLLPDPAIGTRLSYRLIYPDAHDAGRRGPGRFMSKELGNVIVGGDASGEGGGGGGMIYPTEEEAVVVTPGPMAGPLGGDPDKTLQDARFVIGDYISCAIFPPYSNGSVAAAPAAAGSSGSRHGGGGGLGRDMGDYRGGGGGGRGGPSMGPRENGYGGFRGRGGPRPGGGPSNGGRLGDGGLPSGEWRRGERIPDGPGGRGYGRGRGRGY